MSGGARVRSEAGRRSEGAGAATPPPPSNSGGGDATSPWFTTVPLVDTLSVKWKGTGVDAAADLLETAYAATGAFRPDELLFGGDYFTLRRLPRYGGLAFKFEPWGMTVGVLRRYGIVFAEFRPSNVVSGITEPGALAAASVEEADRWVRSYLCLANVDQPQMRRLDTACDVTMVDPRRGVEFLDACSRLVPPAGMKTTSWRAPEAVETVALRLGRNVVARIYDRNEARRALGDVTAGPRGEVIRLEAQRRWKGEAPSIAEVLTPEQLSNEWWTRFASLDGMSAGSAGDIVDHVVDLVRLGDLSPQRGTSLIGAAAIFDRGTAPGKMWSSQTVASRRRDLRSAGLLPSKLVGGTVVDLGEVARASRLAWIP